MTAACLVIPGLVLMKSRGFYDDFGLSLKASIIPFFNVVMNKLVMDFKNKNISSSEGYLGCFYYQIQRPQDKPSISGRLWEGAQLAIEFSCDSRSMLSGKDYPGAGFATAEAFW